MIQVDRSRILDAQSCPRKRWWAYHFGGKGIQRLSKSLPLVLGGTFHDGMATLMEGKEIDAAVLRAQLELSNAFEEKGIVVEGDAQLAMFEQGALVEGMLRAWEIHEGESFRNAFEVIEVEQEGVAELAEGMELLYRPDAVVRERSSGDVYVLSLKTCSSYSQITFNQAQTDMQSMSEVFGVQQKLGLKVEGVLYRHIVKGRRALDDYSGQYRQDSHLIYGWVRGNGEDQEWAWKYRYPREEELIGTVDGKQYTQRYQQLPKGFRKVSVWDNYEGGVKAWIEALAAREIIPRTVHPFDSIFPQSLPISRREDEIESWKRQIVAQETNIAGLLRAIEYKNGEMDDDGELLDQCFPQHTARCFDWSSKCQFWDACFTPSVTSDPLGSGLYKIREANHSTEASDEG
jgi:hypothetical protein